MLTRNRLPLLRLALPAMLRTLSMPSEILIINNGSDDGTGEFLDRFPYRNRFPNIVSFRVIHHCENQGTQAYNSAMFSLSAPVLIEVDDDVIRFPDGWDRKLTDALIHGNRIGYVSTDVWQDEWTSGNRADSSSFPTQLERLSDGGTIETGIVGGWCAATPRALFHAVGGFPFRGRGEFELEDGGYANVLAQSGWRFGIRTDVKVYHACGAKLSKALGLDKGWREKYDPNTDPRYLAIRNAIDQVALPEQLPAIFRTQILLTGLLSSLQQTEKMFREIWSNVNLPDQLASMNAACTTLQSQSTQQMALVAQLAEGFAVPLSTLTFDRFSYAIMGAFDEEDRALRLVLHRIRKHLRRIANEPGIPEDVVRQLEHYVPNQFRELLSIAPRLALSDQ
ncbi:MAG: glycosyltransferase [bacterium]|nr:glycosyltransferase [bacterium]